METIKLDTSLTVDGIEIRELNLRKPKVKDLLIASKKNLSDSEREVQLIANLAEIPAEAVEDLDLSDYMKVQNWLQNFLSVSTKKR